MTSHKWIIFPNSDSEQEKNIIKLSGQSVRNLLLIGFAMNRADLSTWRVSNVNQNDDFDALFLNGQIKSLEIVKSNFCKGSEKNI